MIRTILISAALLAAGAANAGEVKVSLAGKTEATIRSELIAAAKEACSGTPTADYTTCVQDSYVQAMVEFAKIKAIKLASVTF